MSQQHNEQSILTSYDAAQLSLRERVGLVVQGSNAATVIARIREAEQAGVRQVWMTQSVGMLDTLTVFAAAAVQTTHIRLGTAIIPIYPRHPLVMAQQAATIKGLGSGRLRLGVGPSHRHVMESIYGLAMPAPLAYLREYVEVLHQALWQGRVDHQGTYFKVAANLPAPTPLPLLVSTLGEKAFQLAGEISDGALS